MYNVEAIPSTLNSDDAFHIERIVKEWIDEGETKPEYKNKYQDKVKGAITVLKQIDNVTVNVKSKSHTVTDVQIQTIKIKKKGKC